MQHLFPSICSPGEALPNVCVAAGHLRMRGCQPGLQQRNSSIRHGLGCPTSCEPHSAGILRMVLACWAAFSLETCSAYLCSWLPASKRTLQVKCLWHLLRRRYTCICKRMMASFLRSSWSGHASDSKEQHNPDRGAAGCRWLSCTFLHTIWGIALPGRQWLGTMCRWRAASLLRAACSPACWAFCWLPDSSVTPWSHCPAASPPFS